MDHGRNRAVFLDRDGTINEEVCYLRRIEDLKLLPGVPEGIRMLNEHGFKVVVVTNQSGVARGYFDEAFLARLHEEMDRLIASRGGRVDAWYYCPHHPVRGRGKYLRACSCRKPSTGMLEEAARDLALDLSRSFVVGDGAVDVELALNAGARPVVVLTGYGRKTLSDLPEGRRRLISYVAADLLDACEWITGAAAGAARRGVPS